MSNFKLRMVKTVAKANENLKKVQRYTDIVSKMVTGPKSVHAYVDHAVRLATTGADHFLEKNNAKGDLVDLWLLEKECKGDLTRIVSADRKAERSDGLAPPNHKKLDVYGESIYVPESAQSMYHHKNDDHNKVKAAIARAVWETSNGFISISGQPYQAMYVDNKLRPPQIPSSRADAIGSRIEAYLEKGKKRSILLYGSPGTGKSSIAASICGKLFKRTLIMSINYGISGEVLARAITDFAPEAIILNELDKGAASGSLLEALDLMNQKLKLTIGTANVTNFMNKALIRPGRFDEVISIEGVDDITLKALINFDCSPELREELKFWPIAFLNELRHRVEVEPELFDEHLDNLRKRLNLNQEESNKGKKDDDDD